MSRRYRPPRILEYLLEQVSHPDDSESLLGDFAEVYSYTAQDSGHVYALGWCLYHFIKLILYTALFAIPLAYFSSDALFQFFAFRPRLYLSVLPAAFLFILSLAIFTVGSQTVKAAFTNPADTLRME